MINIENYLYEKVKRIITHWNDEAIYAISFFVESNESKEYRGYFNVTDFFISYNTEKDCVGASAFSEERWNYAFWRQNQHAIIDTAEENEGANILFDWYKEQGIDNIGFENEDCYNDEYQYIGKGPIGHYELLTLVSNVAKRLQKELFLQHKFSKIIPIIIHGLEYAWYDIEATQNANPNGEADIFLQAMSQNGLI